MEYARAHCFHIVSAGTVPFLSSVGSLPEKSDFGDHLDEIDSNRFLNH